MKRTNTEATGRGWKLAMVVRVVLALAFPDVAIEFESPAALAILKSVPDSHVMYETLRACSLQENSLERTFRD